MSQSDFDLDKLIKLCGMFGSEFEGERANAAMMADKMLKKTGIKWENLLKAGDFSSTQSHDYADELSDREKVRYIYENGEAFLTEWEENFIESVIKRTYFSHKQSEIIDRIYEKCIA